MVVVTPVARQPGGEHPTTIAGMQAGEMAKVWQAVLEQFAEWGVADEDAVNISWNGGRYRHAEHLHFKISFTEDRFEALLLLWGENFAEAVRLIRDETDYVCAELASALSMHPSSALAEGEPYLTWCRSC